MEEELAVRLTDVTKEYRLGRIGYGTLYRDLQSRMARLRGREDPNLRIGQRERRAGDAFLALDHVSLTVRRGEALGIIGMNGAGKSTLLKLLSRVTGPTAGTIEINGRVSSMLEVGTGFHGEMTGRENVYLNGAILGMSRAEITAKLPQIIAFSEIGEFIDTPVKRYSSGMYVKLAFSVAAHLDADLMIMDEVLAVGDLAFQRKCLDRMRRAAAEEGCTVLYVSHNMDTIRRLCSRCIVLHEGRVVFDGAPEEAIARYAGVTGSASLHRVYTEKEQKGLRQGHFLFTECRFTEKAVCEFAPGEPVRLAVKCRASVALKNVALQLQLLRGGTVIGSMHAENVLPPFAAGEERWVALTLDSSELAPGNYTCNLAAHIAGEYGDRTLLSGVFPGFAFTITEDGPADLLHPVWKPSWGPVKFRPLRAEPCHAPPELPEPSVGGEEAAP